MATKRRATSPGNTKRATRKASPAKRAAAAKTTPAKRAAATKTTPAKAAPAKAAPTKVAPTASVAESWASIERWFAAQHPGVALNLRPPATAAQIAAAEKALRVRFPEEFRASLAVHDGQEDWPGVRLWPFAQRLGSLASLTRCWKDDRGLYDDVEMRSRMDWLDDGQRVRQVHLHPRHIPVAGSKYWDYGRLLLDFEPGPRGAAGQVIARDDVDFVFVVPSFGELLARTARGLEAGTIVVQPGGDSLELRYLARPGGKPVAPDRYFGG